MKPPEIRKYLFDMWQACELLAQSSCGKTLNDYCSDALLRSAIERQFEIIGEALSQAIKLAPDQISDSGWRWPPDGVYRSAIATNADISFCSDTSAFKPQSGIWAASSGSEMQSTIDRLEPLSS